VAIAAGGASAQQRAAMAAARMTAVATTSAPAASTQQQSAAMVAARTAAIATADPSTPQQSAAITAVSAGAIAAGAVANPLGNLTDMHSCGVAYRWQRDGLTVDLKDRDGHWTEHEAVQVRDALDQLPDLYVHKAIAGGMHQIYRDGRFPSAPWQFVSPPTDPLHAVTVPVYPWYCVAVGDNLFKEDDFLVYRVITHELGHAIQWGISGWATIVTGTPGFTCISWTTDVPGTGMKSWNGFVTDYARTRHMEDFAETAKFYWINPDALQRINPAKFRFMRDVVFEGLVSPPEARSTRQDGIAPVVPAITSLGDAHDDWSSLVQVHGSYFMGPFDGGYNKVRYRGTTATHVPISEKTVYSWVPWIDAGSAPITLETQDGTSAAAAFTVDKPWWKFW
jgi:hypothetical protein